MAGYQYNSLSPVQTGLLGINRIDLYGEVEKDLAQYVRDALMILSTKGSPDIDVIISSNGGNVDYGLDIYDMLKFYEGEKCATVVGYARSMGAIVLQACTRRFVVPHARILIHHINRKSISLDQLRNQEKLQEVLKEMELNQAKLYKILASRTGKSLETIKKVCEEDRDMSAEEAKEFGLVDEVLGNESAEPAGTPVSAATVSLVKS